LGTGVLTDAQNNLISQMEQLWRRWLPKEGRQGDHSGFFAPVPHGCLASTGDPRSSELQACAALTIPAHGCLRKLFVHTGLAVARILLTRRSSTTNATNAQHAHYQRHEKSHY
jgi:hypothetical protein